MPISAKDVVEKAIEKWRNSYKKQTVNPDVDSNTSYSKIEQKYKLILHYAALILIEYELASKWEIDNILNPLIQDIKHCDLSTIQSNLRKNSREHEFSWQHFLSPTHGIIEVVFTGILKRFDGKLKREQMVNSASFAEMELEQFHKLLTADLSEAKQIAVLKRLAKNIIDSGNKKAQQLYARYFFKQIQSEKANVVKTDYHNQNMRQICNEILVEIVLPYLFQEGYPNEWRQYKGNHKHKPKLAKDMFDFLVNLLSNHNKLVAILTLDEQTNTDNDELLTTPLWLFREWVLTNLNYLVGVQASTLKKPLEQLVKFKSISSDYSATELPLHSIVRDPILASYDKDVTTNDEKLVIYKLLEALLSIPAYPKALKNYVYILAKCVSNADINNLFVLLQSNTLSEDGRNVLRLALLNSQGSIAKLASLESKLDVIFEQIETILLTRLTNQSTALSLLEKVAEQPQEGNSYPEDILYVLRQVNQLIERINAVIEKKNKSSAGNEFKMDEAELASLATDFRQLRNMLPHYIAKSLPGEYLGKVTYIPLVEDILNKSDFLEKLDAEACLTLFNLLARQGNKDKFLQKAIAWISEQNFDDLSEKVRNNLLAIINSILHNEILCDVDEGLGSTYLQKFAKHLPVEELLELTHPNAIVAVLTEKEILSKLTIENCQDLLSKINIRTPEGLKVLQHISAWISQNQNLPAAVTLKQSIDKTLHLLILDEDSLEKLLPDVVSQLLTTPSFVNKCTATKAKRADQHILYRLVQKVMLHSYHAEMVEQLYIPADKEDDTRLIAYVARWCERPDTEPDVIKAQMTIKGYLAEWMLVNWKQLSQEFQIEPKIITKDDTVIPEKSTVRSTIPEFLSAEILAARIDEKIIDVMAQSQSASLFSLIAYLEVANKQDALIKLFKQLLGAASWVNNLESAYVINNKILSIAFAEVHDAIINQGDVGARTKLIAYFINYANANISKVTLNPVQLSELRGKIGLQDWINLLGKLTPGTYTEQLVISTVTDREFARSFDTISDEQLATLLERLPVVPTIIELINGQCVDGSITNLGKCILACIGEHPAFGQGTVVQQFISQINVHALAELVMAICRNAQVKQDNQLAAVILANIDVLHSLALNNCNHAVNALIGKYAGKKSNLSAETAKEILFKSEIGKYLTADSIVVLLQKMDIHDLKEWLLGLTLADLAKLTPTIFEVLISQLKDKNDKRAVVNYFKDLVQLDVAVNDNSNNFREHYIVQEILAFYAIKNLKPTKRTRELLIKADRKDIELTNLSAENVDNTQQEQHLADEKMAKIILSNMYLFGNTVNQDELFEQWSKLLSAHEAYQVAMPIGMSGKPTVTEETLQNRGLASFISRQNNARQHTRTKVLFSTFTIDKIISAEEIDAYLKTGYFTRVFSVEELCDHFVELAKPSIVQTLKDRLQLFHRANNFEGVWNAVFGVDEIEYAIELKLLQALLLNSERRTKLAEDNFKLFKQFVVRLKHIDVRKLITTITVGNSQKEQLAIIQWLAIYILSREEHVKDMTYEELQKIADYLSVEQLLGLTDKKVITAIFLSEALCAKLYNADSQNLSILFEKFNQPALTLTLDYTADVIRMLNQRRQRLIELEDIALTKGLLEDQMAERNRLESNTVLSNVKHVFTEGLCRNNLLSTFAGWKNNPNNSQKIDLNPEIAYFLLTHAVVEIGLLGTEQAGHQLTDRQILQLLDYLKSSPEYFAKLESIWMWAARPWVNKAEMVGIDNLQALHAMLPAQLRKHIVSNWSICVKDRSFLLNVVFTDSVLINQLSDGQLSEAITKVNDPGTLLRKAQALSDVTAKAKLLWKLYSENADGLFLNILTDPAVVNSLSNEQIRTALKVVLSHSDVTSDLVNSTSLDKDPQAKAKLLDNLWDVNDELTKQMAKELNIQPTNFERAKGLFNRFIAWVTNQPVVDQQKDPQGQYIGLKVIRANGEKLVVEWVKATVNSESMDTDQKRIEAILNKINEQDVHKQESLSSILVILKKNKKLPALADTTLKPNYANYAGRLLLPAVKQNGIPAMFEDASAEDKTAMVTMLNRPLIYAKLTRWESFQLFMQNRRTWFKSSHKLNAADKAQMVEEQAIDSSVFEDFANRLGFRATSSNQSANQSNGNSTKSNVVTQKLNTTDNSVWVQSNSLLIIEQEPRWFRKPEPLLYVYTKPNGDRILIDKACYDDLALPVTKVTVANGANIIIKNGFRSHVADVRMPLIDSPIVGHNGILNTKARKLDGKDAISTQELKLTKTNVIIPASPSVDVRYSVNVPQDTILVTRSVISQPMNKENIVEFPKKTEQQIEVAEHKYKQENVLK